MFKIGQLVKYDGTGVPIMARVEGYKGRRVRIAVLPEGLHLTVAAGDLAVPGEDEARIAREMSAMRWALGGITPHGRTDGQGNYASLPIPNPDFRGSEDGDQGGRH